jgi:hypothetical protein
LAEAGALGLEVIDGIGHDFDFFQRFLGWRRGFTGLYCHTGRQQQRGKRAIEV